VVARILSPFTETSEALEQAVDFAGSVPSPAEAVSR
jgi:hypothetical protein